MHDLALSLEQAFQWKAFDRKSFRSLAVNTVKLMAKP